MHPEQIRSRKQEIIARYGPWTAHSIHLADGVNTFDQPHWDTRLRRFVQITSDLSRKPLQDLRVLDLACLEGHFGIEFAVQGARVVATEGRPANLEKARFAKEALGLDKLELVLDDVRNLSVDRYGTFDVVLCLGILYHLDAPDVMDFVRRIASVCEGLVIIDTHIALSDDSTVQWEGNTYWGIYAGEHDVNATAEEREAAKWSSLDNPRSFLLTKASLSNLLRHTGFTSVYECLNPFEFHSVDWPRNPEGRDYGVWEDRTTLVAVKGKQCTLISSPSTNRLPEVDRAEHPNFLAGHLLPGRSAKLSLRSRLAGLLPPALRRLVRCSASRFWTG
jgi:2-polyprenyl-3-methyl-5-hydroxy-6-metoxy-1,4-benzoquinol methylase